MRYGYPSNQRPQRPPEASFEYCVEEISPIIAPAVQIINPPPSDTPPVGFTFPRSLRYEVIHTRYYQRGYVAVANFETSQKSQIKSAQMRMLLPRESKAIHPLNSPYQPPVIPGCVRLVPNLPMAQTIDGDSKVCLTVAGIQTLASMKQVLWPHKWPPFLQRFIRLAENTWGTKTREPFFTQPGLKRNDRSAKDFPEDSYDGSYNLASTVIKGDGQGTVAPAVQARTEESAVQIQEIIDDLVFMGREVLKAVCSKNEWEMIQFHSEDNNVFSCGGAHLATNIQGNVACFVRELSDAIGALQGAFHFDQGDDFVRFTVGVLLLRLPSGKSC